MMALIFRPACERLGRALDDKSPWRKPQAGELTWENKVAELCAEYDEVLKSHLQTAMTAKEPS